MTVVLSTHVNHYIGDTADSKPTGVPAGSTYLDRQTGIFYITYDGTNWSAWTRIFKLGANSGVDIGDVDVKSIAAGTNLIGKMGIDQVTANANEVVLKAGSAAVGSVKDGGPSWTTVFGVAGVRFTSADQSAAAAAVTDAPTGGQKIVVDDLIISTDTSMRVDISIETAGTIMMSIYLAANSTAQVTLRDKWKLATADKKLMVQASVAGNISVSAFYHSEA